ncbi:MAG: PSD1 and planctomycete cytochrome C domain-containing protein [Planctomycetota bacterium]|nr:PSD1 and planctomycete cytochrome C domain-containing protein [Planctomycetota bacterium]
MRRTALFRRLLPLFLTCCLSAVDAIAQAAPDFNRDVAPILVKRCLECHNARDANGKLVLTTAERTLAGGEGGEAIVPGMPDDSPLLTRVTTGQMPPPRRGKPQTLPPAEQQILRDWIADGAKWPENRTLDLFESTTDVRGGRDWWSLQPVRRPDVPGNVAKSEAIDAFIRDSLSREEMEPAPQADRTTLIRRVYYDLIGLPPTRAEIETFVNAPEPDAYERLVDRLLASPQFGERWARLWLDVVRFAETCGYERDQVKPFAWKYRDWVVNAFNRDKPYDRFILEQIAGDELEDRSEESVVGTGFLMLGTWNDEPNDPQEYKYERLEDLVHSTSSAFLAFSVKCARCHDHKFDPISQEDYYRFANAFWPGAIEPRDGKYLGGPNSEELGFANVLGWTDVRREPPPLHAFRKGDPKHPLEVVEPGHLSMLPELVKTFEPTPAGAPTTRRRLQLARWIANKANPLTARVMVNRLWQHHFGQGLVRSANDFGFNGAAPTHPELLDWLASELMDNDWKLKSIHRQMVLSKTYRQASLHPQQRTYANRDSANRFWWHAERRRRDAEGLRDAMLAAAGELDLTLGGPSFKPSISAEALEGLSRKSGAWQASASADQRRRSLYIFTQRSLLPPLMTVFDFSDTTLPCAQRDVTTVAPQALALLNNEFVHERSAALARQVEEMTKTGGDRVAAVWQLALGRAPTLDEVTKANSHLAQQARAFADLVREASPENPSEKLPVTESLVLHLRADLGVETDSEGRLTRWADQSPAGHHATQAEAESRPAVVQDSIQGHAALSFDGKRRFLKLAGQVVKNRGVTLFAVATDRGSGGHREILSNWNGTAGNSTTSLFLGTTADGLVRLSDDFAPAGQIERRDQPFVLTASVGEYDATVYQNDRELKRKGSPLAPRKLETDWVIGTQGNIDGEYWTGEIAELVVFDRELTEKERRKVWSYLMGRYRPVDPVPPPSPEQLALASLCHVLLNTNEFLYVD